MILQLIDKAGDFVSDDIWFRVVQFVTNNEDLQVKGLYNSAHNGFDDIVLFLCVFLFVRVLCVQSIII